MYNKNISNSKALIKFLEEEYDNGNGLIKGTGTNTLNLHTIPTSYGSNDKIKYHWKRIYPVYISNNMKERGLLGIAIGWASYSLTHDNKLDYDWIKKAGFSEKSRLKYLKDMQALNIVQKIGKGSYYLNPSIMSNTDSIPKNINDLFKDNSTIRAK